MPTTADILSFWGKGRPPEGAPVPYHPVVYHLLDVAAVADALLSARPLARARAARLLGIDEEAAHRLLVMLIALHDLGKFTPGFQGKVPTLWPPVLGPFQAARLKRGTHTDDGYRLWYHVLAPRIGDRLWNGGRDALEVLAPAIFGHHGRPVVSAMLREQPAEWVFEAPAVAIALECAEALVALLHPEPIEMPAPDTRLVRIASWWLAGLVTIADWIGSREELFAYTAPDVNDTCFERYWAAASHRARDAVRAEGLMPPTSARPRSFSSLTGIPKPSPLQEWASSAELPEGPLLVLIEDVTGAGKTEAAQMIVHRLMAAGRVSGAYWAMPTQATANAMYGRQAKAIDALFAPGASRPSIALAHGQVRLHEGFRSTVLPVIGADPARMLVPRSSDAELPAGAACAAFFADDRRAALLADVGAGTVDQALLGVLPNKFNAVRLFGVADKVVVVDEAHSYDAYMGVELEELLRFQAALGGCAVVLSATLSVERREQLARAWRDGAGAGQRVVAAWSGQAAPALVHEMSYPLATIVTAGEPAVCERPLEAAPWSRRSVRVRLVHEADDALSRVVEAARCGAAVAWIRNAVDDCLESARAVREHGIEPLVFHARFAQCDRQAREAEVLRLFGPSAMPGERRGRVLVATQVVEQSLDLDFDCLVTDLAPIDLLIQRAGRWRRHPSRDDTRPEAVDDALIVLSPAPDSNAPADWVRALLPRTARVYENAGVLWRTARVLAEAGAIETPGGVRPLIEGVYGASAPEIPPELESAANRAEGKARGNASAANYATLRVDSGYDGSAHAWVNELRAPTRLSDARVTIRLARIRPDGTLAPWAPEVGPTWKRWALSEVSVPARRVSPTPAEMPDHAAAVEAVRREWGPYEQEIPVLPLVESADGGWTGMMEGRGRTLAFRYTAEEGLTIQ